MHNIELPYSKIHVGGDINHGHKYKVAILHTGGTIGMVYNKSGYLDTSKNILKDKILSLKMLNVSEGNDVPLFRKGNQEFEYCIYDFDSLIDSSDMNTEYYGVVIRCIMKYYNSYDAFIILHGTDTLAYTAAMLSIFLENLNKPIFITGSAYSIFEHHEYSDAYSNIMTTFEYTCLVKAAGVYVCCNNKLFDAKNCKKFSSVVTDMFYYRRSLCLSSSNVPDYLKRNEMPRFPINFEFPKRIKIASLFITPLNHLNIFKKIPLKKDEIMLIHGYGNGNVPFCGDLLNLIERHTKKGGLSIIISQCPDSFVVPLYSSWEKLNELGALSSGNMTIEYLIAKISYLIAKKTPWNLMKLLIFIDFDPVFENNMSELFKILAKLFEQSGIEASFSNSVAQQKISSEDILLDIQEGILGQFFENPYLYYTCYTMKNGYNFDDVRCVIMRSLFMYLNEYFKREKN